MATPARKPIGRPGSPRRPVAIKRRARPQQRVANRRSQKPFPPSTPAALVHELGSCITEADIVQVLYRGLEPLFGYEVIVLQSLEREGWYHSLPIDSGVLQDMRRRPLATSMFAPMYAKPQITLVPIKDPTLEEQAKGAAFSPVVLATAPAAGRLRE